MATLVLGAVGSAIGGAFGGAILGFSGAAIGGFIGSTIGSVVDNWIVSSLAPAQRIEGARLDSLRITSSTEGAVIPRLYGRMRIGGNIIWATDFREETKTTTPGRRQGRRGRQGQDHRIPLLCQLRRGAVRGRDHRHWPRLGRRQADGHDRRHLALVSGQRGADAPIRSSRPRWARPTRPPIAAPPMSCSRNWTSATFGNRLPQLSLRGVPPAGRSRHRRGAGQGRDDDPGLGRVHLCDRAGQEIHRLRRRDRGREPERDPRHRRHRRGAGPAAGHGPGGRKRQPGRRLVRR